MFVEMFFFSFTQIYTQDSQERERESWFFLINFEFFFIDLKSDFLSDCVFYFLFKYYCLRRLLSESWNICDKFEVLLELVRMANL